MTIEIINYSERAIAVVGDTKSIKDKLKELGGRFNFRLTCGAGWIFPKSKTEQVSKLIGCEYTTTTPSAPVSVPDVSKFKTWLTEYAEIMSDFPYYVSNSVGAIKIGEQYIRIEKPTIKTDFCFRDEGIQLDQYNNLMSEEGRLRDYFLSKNRSEFAEDIKRIKEGNDMYFRKLRNDKTTEFYVREFEGQAWFNEEDRIATNEEKQLILEGLEFGLSLFEKRLQTYLKRYGVSKLHTWTYWADR